MDRADPPSFHLTGCDLEYLDDERVVGSYRPSLFVGILLAGEHTGFVDGHSIATTRVGVPTLLGVSDQVDIRSAQRPGQTCRMSGFHVGAEFLRELGEEAGLPGCETMLDSFADGFLWQEVEARTALRAHLCSLPRTPIRAGSRSSIPRAGCGPRSSRSPGYSRNSGAGCHSSPARIASMPSMRA